MIAKALTDQFNTELREQLAQAIKERDAAEQSAQATRDQLMKAWVEKVIAEKATKEAQRQLEKERGTKPQGTASSRPRQVAGVAIGGARYFSGAGSRWKR